MVTSLESTTPAVVKKEKEQPSHLVNGSLTVITMIAEGLTSAFSPADSVAPPFAARVASGTAKASVIAADDSLRKSAGLTSWYARTFCFFAKYPVLVGVTGLAIATDVVMNRYPHLNTQWGPTMAGVLAGVVFTDIKKQILLVKEEKAPHEEESEVLFDEELDGAEVSVQEVDECGQMLALKRSKSALEEIEKKPEKKSKKKKTAASLPVSLSFSAGSVGVAAVSAALLPEKVITPILASLAAKVNAIGARPYDKMWTCIGLSKESSKKYGVLVKYVPYALAVGVGAVADWAFKTGKVLPISFDPQLGPILGTAIFGMAFDDFKRRVILQKEDNPDEEALPQDIEMQNKEVEVEMTPLPAIKKKKDKQPSVAVNTLLSVGSVAAAGIAACVDPETVVPPFLAGVAAGTLKASARTLDDMGERVGLSKEYAEKYGFQIKYIPLAVASGGGFMLDYALSHTFGINPQLGVIGTAALVTSIFRDVKVKVLQMKDDEEDM